MRHWLMAFKVLQTKSLIRVSLKTLGTFVERLRYCSCLVPFLAVFYNFRYKNGNKRK